MKFILKSTKGKVYLSLGAIFALIIIAGNLGGSSTPAPAVSTSSAADSSGQVLGAQKQADPMQATQPQTEQQTQQTFAPIQTAPAAASSDNTGAPTTNLSNNNTYTNVDDNTVHSPAYSTDNSVPAGATARCADGTYSFSQNHRGTCSHHGGVAEWLQ